MFFYFDSQLKLLKSTSIIRVPNLGSSYLLSMKAALILPGVYSSAKYHVLKEFVYRIMKFPFKIHFWAVFERDNIVAAVVITVAVVADLLFRICCSI